MGGGDECYPRVVMHAPCFALVDCNNFYASCERIFNPKIIDKPVIVLSSNDGCVIARSNEAKSLGIKMGQPYFQIAALCERQRVAVFSSNFALYGDISKRLMRTLIHLCPDIEIYSIDEAFLRLDKMPVDSVDFARTIKKTIWQHIGIPVSIGIAPTKTLAKVASHLAKQNPTIGIYDLRNEKVRDIILTQFPVEQLWGVGKKYAMKLQDLNIVMASQLSEKPLPYLKQQFSVMMTRLVLELKGISCLSLEELHNKKNIICSRSFGKPVTELVYLLEAISSYCAIACEKARTQKTKAQGVMVFLHTSRFNKTQPYYSASDQQALILPSNDTVLVTQIANQLIKKLFKSPYRYQKVGVMLLNLTSENNFQGDLLVENNNADNQKLMSLLDGVNQKWGRKTLFLAAEGSVQSWSVKSVRRSARYTTCWNELPIIK